MEEPLSLALKEITQTRRLLELLITSSENFDYQTAKLALAQLDQKVRHLAKVESQLAARLPLAPNIQEVIFVPQNSDSSGARTPHD
jgi:hypothetical protein